MLATPGNRMEVLFSASRRERPTAAEFLRRSACDQLPPPTNSAARSLSRRHPNCYDCVLSVTMSEGPEARWTGEQYDDLHFARALYCDGDPRNDGEAGKPFRSD